MYIYINTYKISILFISTSKHATYQPMVVPGADVLGAGGGGAEDHFAPGGAGARDGAAQGGGGEQSARCETASCVCRVWLVNGW